MKSRKRVIYKSDKPSMCQKHLKNECDVNSILDRFKKTGQINHVRGGTPQYGDFSQYRDFQSNLNLVLDAQASFSELPAHIRKRFGNDPAQLLEFISNSKNIDEAVKLGLAEKKAAQTQIPKNDDQTTKNPESTQAATPPATKA